MCSMLKTFSVSMNHVILWCLLHRSEFSLSQWDRLQNSHQLVIKFRKIFRFKFIRFKLVCSFFYVCLSVKVKVSSKIVTKFNYFSKKKNIQQLLSTSFFLRKNKSIVGVQFFVHVINYRYLWNDNLNRYNRGTRL